MRGVEGTAANQQSAMPQSLVILIIMAMSSLVWEMLLNDSMITIVGKVTRHGRRSLEKAVVPANHTEAQGVSTWGLVIAGGLLLLTTTFICLILFKA
jgi:hypothetical protein